MISTGATHAALQANYATVCSVPSFMSSPTSETKYYHHGRFTFAGGTLPDAFTAYRIYGDPKNPCIVFPTCYGGRLDSKALNNYDDDIYLT